MSIARSWWIAGILTAGLVLAGTYVLSLWNLEAAQGEREDWARAAAEGLARRLAEELMVLRQEARGLSSDSRIIAAMREGAEATLAGLERSLTQGFPRGTRLRLLPPGFARMETQRDAQMSFASLDFVRVAEESGQPTLFEIHGLNSEHPHLAVATPIIGADGVVGVAHLALPFDMLRALVVGSGSPAMRLVVQQVTGAAHTELASSGEAVAAGIPAGTVAVPGAPWQVAFWTSGPASTGRGIGTIGVWGGAAVLVLLIALVLWSGAAGQLAALRRDLNVLSIRLRRPLAGSRVDTGGVRIRELKKWISGLGAAAEGAGAGPPGAESPTDVASSVSREDSQPGQTLTPAPSSPRPGAVVFRAYDVRGVVGQGLTTGLMAQLGRAVGSEALQQGRQTVLLGRDGRSSSPDLAKALREGLLASGRDVVDLGGVPTPVFYFATHFLGSDTGVMVTGSHNPPDYNGAKIVIAGETLCGDSIQSLARRIETSSYSAGEGHLSQQDLVPDYVQRIADDIHLARPMKLVIDSGNGIAGSVAPGLFRELGCDVVELYCEVDGRFPNHQPDPSRPENLQTLALEVQSHGAELGLAFDGDGDRLGVVDSSGKIIWPDRILMLFAVDVLARHPGADIVFDVKSSRLLSELIRHHGGRPVMGRTGHSFLKARVRETSAPVGGELSGHIVFVERWYGFDDAMYAGARLIELLSADPRASSEVFAELPEGHSTPELQLAMSEGEPPAVMADLGAASAFQGTQVIRIDGLRAEYSDGWGLVRASNTAPTLVFRFEADTAAALERIQGEFRKALLEARPGLTPPF